MTSISGIPMEEDGRFPISFSRSVRGEMTSVMMWSLHIARMRGMRRILFQIEKIRKVRLRFLIIIDLFVSTAEP